MKRVVARDQQIIGTYDDAMIVALLNAGTLKLADQHWDAATSAWRPLTDFVGEKKHARRFGPAVARIAAMLAVAGLGSLVTWFAVKRQPRLVVMPAISHAAGNIQAAPGAPVRAVTDTSPAATLRATPPPLEKLRTTSNLAILNVENFEEQLAVTVQNNGKEAVHGFDLKLRYFVLPGDQLVFESNARTLAEKEGAILRDSEKIKELDARLESLKKCLKIVGSEVIMWLPSHIKALPKADEWQALGDAALVEAGRALTRKASAFANGAASDDSVIRENALTRLLPDLGEQASEVKPMLEHSMVQTSADRSRLVTEISLAEEEIASLKRQQEHLQSRLPALMTEAGRKSIRTEIVHVEEVIEPELVKRITVRREKNERHGVIVELARPDEKAVALSTAH